MSLARHLLRSALAGAVTIVATAIAIGLTDDYSHRNDQRRVGDRFENRDVTAAHNNVITGGWA